MVGELITLPLRLGVGATRFWLRATAETVAVVADATGKLIDKATGNRAVAVSAPGATPEREMAPREPVAGATQMPEAGAAAVVTDAPAVASDVPPTEPAHVSEEPELVEQIAEPGAEDGAGASLRIREPWDGYRQMNAEDVIDRLTGASAAELAAIQLYESEHRGRVTVLDAVEHELRSLSNSGSQN
jgi:hypothetical protein